MKTRLYWVVVAAAFLPMLLLRDFTPDNEARYLSIADEALSNHHYFSFTLDGTPYADKPPFYFWLIMLFRQVSGTHSMLLLSLMSLIPAFGIAEIMNRWTHGTLSDSHRHTAVLMLFTSIYFTGASMVVRMDMLMCLFIVLALRSFWMLSEDKRPNHKEQWLMGLWLFMALFTKGPLGLLIPLACSAAYIAVMHKWHQASRVWNWRMWTVLTVGCTAWFCMAYHEAGAGYLSNLLFHQTIGRGINSFHHAHPFYYYLITIWYEMFPWVFIAVGALVASMRKMKRLPDIYRFFLIIVAVTFVLLSCISSKLEIYLLPMFPFTIYVTAYTLSHTSAGKWQMAATLLPEVAMAMALPALLVCRQWMPMPVLRVPMVTAAAGVLSLSSLCAVYVLVAKHCVTTSVRVMAYGILAMLFVAGLAMPEVSSLMK